MEQPLATVAVGSPSPPSPPSPSGPAVSVGTLVSGTFAIWRANLVQFAIVAFAVQLVTVGVAAAVGAPFLAGGNRLGQVTPEAQAFVLTGRYWAFAGLSIVLIFVEAAAMSAGAADHFAGRRVSIGGMLSRVRRRAVPLAVSSFLSSLAFLLGSILLVVPGVIAVLVYSLTVPVAVNEELSGWRVLGRSAALTKGYRARILGLLVIVYVAAFAPGFLAGTLAGGVPYLTTAINVVVGAVMGPLYLVAPAVAYHQLRVAAEGVGTAELERVFG
jgi:hypothetical protein